MDDNNPFNPDFSLGICQECGERPANVHLTQIAPDGNTVFHLCQECAKSKGITISIEPPAALEQEPQQQPQPQKKAEPVPDIRCTVCGMSLAMFREKGRLGCSACYQTFGDEIEKILLQVHGASAHAGKKHRVLVPDSSADVLRLRDELTQAIHNEKFELAATLRDKIYSISQGFSLQRQKSNQ
jgi:protein arginine kinase activator